MTTPSQLPGAFGIPSAAPVYVDGIPAALVAAPSSTARGQRFWSSQPRLAGDPAVEELAVSLGQARIVNYIALDLPRFPHVMTFFWHDGSQWQPLRGSSGAPLEIITSGSVPAVVDSPAALSAGVNPYHYGAGHWAHHDEQVQPVTTSRLLLRATRPGPAPWQQLPVSPAGKHVPYPLGVRNLDMGTRILSSSDVPPATRSPSTTTMRQPFTTTVDVNGSPVQVAVRENRAVDLLGGLTWRCSPQPSSSSVVSLYLDSRDASGNPQPVDRLYLEPVTSGVRMNLYYSPVPPPAGTPFRALDDPLPPSLLAADGTQFPVAGPHGISFSAEPGWLTVSGQASGTIISSPWWAGIEVMPSFASSDPGTYVILDSGALTLSFTAGTWTAVTAQGGTIAEWSFAFSAGDRLQFVFGQDGLQLFAWSPLGQMSQSPLTAPLQGAPSFRFGALLGSPGALAGNYVLTAFILKQEDAGLLSGGQGGVPPGFSLFAADPAAYVSPPLGQPTTDSAVIRFAPSFILGTVSPWGFVGGLGAAYEACPWVPVRRSLALARGYVELDPVTAAAWKLEFTALQPEPYEYLQPVTVTARVHLPQHQPSPRDLSPVAAAQVDPGLSVAQAVAPSVRFSDAPSPSPAPSPGAALPTEALYAPDLATASGLALRGGSLWSLQPWQPPHVIPVAPVSGPSAYQESAYTIGTRVAYFVALSSVALYRVDYTAASDTEQYAETFADAAVIDPATFSAGGWTLQPGAGLVSPGNIPPQGAQARSLTLASAHAVTGVQFATVQSDAVQLLPDADFSSPSFTGWGPVGDALPLSASPQQSQLGAMCQVSRGSGSASLVTAQQPSSWAWAQSAWPTWAALLGAIPSWLDFGQPPASSAMGGIAWTGSPVPTAGAARVYAAARVFSPVALLAPLYLQLIDGATGIVIAEAEQAVSGGTVTEWFTGFTIGQGLVSSVTWSQQQAAYPTWTAVAAASITWQQADTSTSPLGATVTVRLVQKESTGDTWDVDNISIFEDSILWEFSNDAGATWYPGYDVRNNPSGVVPFPPAPPGAGAQLQWRATAYRPGLFISSLAIRPWYATWPRGIPPRSAGVGHGPNLAPLDHYAPVAQDPRWQASASPLPDSWSFSARQALGITSPATDFPGPPAPPPDAVLGASLIWEPPGEASLEPETYSDLFSDTYTDAYAPADAGDLYTDTYADTYGTDYAVITGSLRSGSAAASAGAVLSATALAIPAPAWGLGADLGLVTASDPSVAALITATGLPVPARRIPLGNAIPASLAASPAAGDAGVRRVLLDVRPDSGTTPAQLDSFLASCQAGGLEASVSVWGGADADFINISDWEALLPAYAAVIRRNGYQHVLTIGNHAITTGWLDAWYPGDDLVDVIAPEFWCTGPAPGSGADTLAAAAIFADAHGKPLGLAGTGVDHARYTTVQGQAFISYLASFFGARKAAGKTGYDVIWLGTGTYSITTAPPALLASYQALARAL